MCYRFEQTRFQLVNIKNDNIISFKIQLKKFNNYVRINLPNIFIVKYYFKSQAIIEKY